MATENEGHALYYTDDLITNLQLRWGEGFMSPGGEEELARMMRGIDLDGLSGLDFGCGIGGYDMALARNHGAAAVLGIDLDGATIEAARQLAESKGLADRLEFRKTDAGPLPFGDGSFDFVFTKDAIVDLPEKGPVFGELFRVTKPGGWFVGSDWFRSEEPYTEEMRKWATTGDETYEMDSLASAAAYVREAGFTDVELDDRNDWFREFARDEYERLKGPLFSVYVENFGEEQAKSSVENARVRWQLAEQGQLRPGHIRARKP